MSKLYRKFIDLISNNRIKSLEGEIEKLWYILAQKEKEINRIDNKPVECFKRGYTGGEDYTISIIGNHVKAIEEYLDIKLEQKWVDDLSYDVPQRKQMKIYIAVPRNTPKND